jgi:hypothetical protein
MAHAILYDTGYGNAGMTGTPLSNTGRAGVNGDDSTINSFKLNISSETMNGGGSVQSDSEIRNDDSLSSASPITFSNPTILLNCSMPLSSIEDEDYKYSWLYQLFRMERTKGVKVLALQSYSPILFKGSCTSDSSTTEIIDANGLYGVDEIQGKTIKFTSGDNEGETGVVLSNTSTTITLTSALPNTTSSGDTYIVYDEVWDYVYNRNRTHTELYGKRYLNEPTKTIVSNITSQTEGTTPHLVGYVKGISNVIISAKDDLVRFAVTFYLIEDLS